MVGESIKTRAGTSQVIWTRCNPSILVSDVGQLVFVECSLALSFGPSHFVRCSFTKSGSSKALLAYGHAALIVSVKARARIAMLSFIIGSVWLWLIYGPDKIAYPKHSRCGRIHSLRCLGIQ